MSHSEEVNKNIAALSRDRNLQKMSINWIRDSAQHRYSYNFQWCGRPIIQYPQDILAMQEIIWNVKPDLILETGIAHGGSLIFYASLLELNAACGGPSDASVLGVDIEIRKENRIAIESHPLYRRIEMIESSSISMETVRSVHSRAREKERVLVVLDSNHTHEHVLAELNAYSSLTTLGSYCVVFDTIIEDLPDGMFPDRPWGVGNNPQTAVREFLKDNSDFVIDEDIHNKLLITVARNGFLRRVKGGGKRSKTSGSED